MSAESKFLERQFRRFYIDNARNIKPPRALSQREFGFTVPDSGGMIRHLAFTSSEDLRAFLIERAPTNSYYSSAIYREPQASEMVLKGWLGADLAFDIDADHIETSCKLRHDSWLCVECQEKGAGRKPEKCPKCNSHKIEEHSWLCPECLGVAKKEAERLIYEFLRDELGFEPDSLEIRFSGHRGYHVLASEERAIKLEQDARREITDYVLGTGISTEGAGFKSVKTRLAGPTLDEKGWQGRIARGIAKLLKEVETFSPEELPLTKADMQILTNKREEILSDLEKTPPIWEWLGKLTKTGRSILVEIVASREASKIDPLVTQDVHRLIRLSGSLHAKTGFIVKPLSLREFEIFDPWRDAVAFKNGSLRIHVQEMPETRVGEVTMGPLRDEDVDVPYALGVYLIAKRRAVFKEP